MRWGHQRKYLEGVRDDMGIMPKGLLSEPEVGLLGGLLYSAFNTLSSSRGYGMGGPLPISISDMAAYCQIFEITDIEERATLITLIQKLDSTYMEIVAAKNATQTKSELVNDGPALDNSSRPIP